MKAACHRVRSAEPLAVRAARLAPGESVREGGVRVTRARSIYEIETAGETVGAAPGALEELLRRVMPAPRRVA